MPSWLNFRHSIFLKFSLAFLTVGMLPLFVLSFLSLNQFTSQVERHTVNNLRQVVLFMSKNADDIFTSYNEISKMMYYNTEGTQSLFDNAIQRQGGGITDSSIDDFLKTVLYSDQYIQNVFFVRTADKAIFYQSRTSRPLDPTEQFPLVNWRYALESQPKKLAIFPPHLEAYFNSPRQVVTMARNLIDTSGKLGKNAHIIGTLYFDIELDVFDNLLKQVKLGRDDQLYVLDGQDNVIYSNDKDIIGKRLGMQDNVNTLDFSEPIPFLSGHVTALVSKTDLYASLSKIQTSVTIATIICLLALVIMGAAFSRMFTGPILAIMRQMLRVESGNLETSVNVTRKDELGRLAHGFNRMIERLNLFINDAYVAEIKRKHAELNALKSQIRPHYLYNTLEVIRMSAVANDDDQVADMIHSLSKQLKYVIDYGEEWVTLGRELDHLRDYFHLIEVRFDNRIKLEIEIKGEELLNVNVLKLSLQPIVENAVQHGIRPKGGKGIVLVTVERDNENLAITVYDDGIGIEENKLREINSHLTETEGSTGKSIGVKNVHERIKNACGEDYGLDIDSKPHVGTSVRILFPLLMEAMSDENDKGSAR
jgi:two-component system sensor histidine kinase YesM